MTLGVSKAHDQTKNNKIAGTTLRIPTAFGIGKRKEKAGIS
jgi:hypothetical protein